MITKKIFLILAFFLLIILFCLFLIAPYHIYTLTLTEGVKTKFLTMSPSKPLFYDGEEILFLKDSIKSHPDDSFYKNFHFSNFQMPMPFNHPLFSFIPAIKTESNELRLGGSFQNGNNVDLFSFVIEKNYKLETISGDQKLFFLPVFSNYIHRKKEEEIWKDLFSKKLALPSNLGRSFYESLFALKKVTYRDLVYNIYILYNRTHLFPENSKRIFFNPEKAHGIIELSSKDPKYRVERLYVIDKGIIYSITIKTKIDNPAAENLRSRFFHETIYQRSTADSAIPLYAQYKNISYSKRTDQQGMTYLFAAWTHDLSNRDYFRVIILFLEKGQSNLKFLTPFYEYAYKKFGSNLSGQADILLESPDEKLKRKIQDELDGEVKKEEMDKTSAKEGEFNSPEEKVDFYFKKAKNSKNNSDDTEKVLIQE